MTSSSQQSPHSDPLDGHRAAVARMLLVFPVTGQENPRDVADAYVSVLRSLPLWAVAEACEQFAKGLVERKVKGLRPAVDLVYELASDLTAKRHREQEREKRLRLPPPDEQPEDPEMRGRVLSEIERWEAWKFSRAEDRKNAPPTAESEEKRRREREQWARSVLADGSDPNSGDIPVSPALERLVRPASGGEAA